MAPLPPPPPPPPQAGITIAARRAVASTAVPNPNLPARGYLLRPATKLKLATAARASEAKDRKSQIRPSNPGGMERDGGTAAEDAAVETVTVTFEAAEPRGVNEVGETVHVAPAGAPVQLNATAWLNPAAGLTLKV